MGSIIITLKKVSSGNWQLFAPKGHALSATFRGDKFEAERWAKNWVTGFHYWTVHIEGDKNEKEN